MTQRDSLRRHDINIAGRNLTIQTDRETEILDNICAYVNARYDEVQATPGLSQANQNVMLALCIAEDLFEERSLHNQKVGRVRQEANQILQRLEKLTSPAEAESE